MTAKKQEAARKQEATLWPAEHILGHGIDIKVEPIYVMSYYYVCSNRYHHTCSTHLLGVYHPGQAHDGSAPIRFPL
jgi:hypothetical protein